MAENDFWLEENEKVNFTLDNSVLFDTDVSLEELDSSFDFQVNYHFPASSFRNPITVSGKTYGQAWNFDMLYRKLCAEFNDGQLFIDAYFDNVFPYTLKEEMKTYLETIKKDIVNQYDEITDFIKKTKKGDFDKRYRTVLRSLFDFTSFASDLVKEEGNYWSQRIKDDIIQCMRTGVLPSFFAKQDLAESTQKKRLEAGLLSEPVFMATGQLIESIIIDVHLGKKQWKQEYSITV